MKSLFSLVALLCLGFVHPVAAAEPPKPLTAVKLAITNDLVKDFPIEISATTTEEEIRCTFGPKPDGLYCVMDAQIERRADGSAKITVTFSEETKVLVDGAQSVRNVGFGNLSTVLSPGEEETLFSSGEKKFVVKLVKQKKS